MAFGSAIYRHFMFLLKKERKHSFFWNLLKYSSNAVLKLKDQFLRVLPLNFAYFFLEEGDILS